jgi:molybdate transport system substrate-binding protein
MEQIIVLSTGAYKAALDEILAVFAQQTGRASRAVYDSATSVAARIEAGERFDIVITIAGSMAALATKNFISGPRLPAGSNAVCLAYAGTAPDISAPESLRAALLAASSISLSDPKHGGGSSKYFLDLLESLGIGAAVTPKLLLTPGGKGAVPVAEGRAQFGIAQTSEIAMLPGVAAAPFPGSEVAYELGLSVQAHPASAALAAFFATPAALAIRAKCSLNNQ